MLVPESLLRLIDAAFPTRGPCAFSPHHCTHSVDAHIVRPSVAFVLMLDAIASFHARVTPAEDTESLVSLISIYSLLLLDRMLQRRMQECARRRFRACKHNSSALLMASLLLSCKMLCDDAPANRWWATTFGVDLRALNSMERTTLRFLKHDVHVTCAEFERAQRLFQRGIFNFCRVPGTHTHSAVEVNPYRTRTQMSISPCRDCYGVPNLV